MTVSFSLLVAFWKPFHCLHIEPSTLVQGRKVMYTAQQRHNNAYITVIPPSLICDSFSSREASRESSGPAFLRICRLFMECGFTVKPTACCLCFPAALQKLPSVFTLHHRDFLTACDPTFFRQRKWKCTANTQTHTYSKGLLVCSGSVWEDLRTVIMLLD